MTRTAHNKQDVEALTDLIGWIDFYTLVYPLRFSDCSTLANEKALNKCLGAYIDSLTNNVGNPTFYASYSIFNEFLRNLTK